MGIFNTFIVAVNYSDLLQITLPYNRHHDETVTIITDRVDYHNVEHIAKANNADVFVTDSFYADGAKFNKFRSLEEAIADRRCKGNLGWVCLRDADVLWPKLPQWPELQIGKLYTPLRRICDPIPTIPPREDEWGRYPIHDQLVEWAGYSQIFHSSDAVLGTPPWHDINWKHAGCGDSFFQAKWAKEDKIRPPFEVLHLGKPWANWMGRSTPYLDGTKHPQAEQHRREMREMLESRRLRYGPKRFKGERVGD